MEVIPAIDILGGQCVRLYQGDYGQVQTFHENPVAVAQEWAAAGATRLHVVDLDGAKAGQPVNLAAIAAITQALDIPVQVGGGLRDRDSVAQLLQTGVQRIILGTVAVEQPDLVRQLCQEFPGQIVVGIDGSKHPQWKQLTWPNTWPPPEPQPSSTPTSIAMAPCKAPTWTPCENSPPKFPFP